jgi:hypothetical protein
MDELEGGLLVGFLPGQPEAVMDVIAPDIAVEFIQLIVMIGNRVAIEGPAGGDH